MPINPFLAVESALATKSLSGSDIVAIVTGVLGLLATCFTGFMALRMAQLKQGADRAAVKVQDVADALAGSDKAIGIKSDATDAKLQAIAVVADATHKLSNSKMGLALLNNTRVWRRLADMTLDPADIAAAAEADAQYKEHQTQQDKVDQKNPGGIPDAADPVAPKPQ